MEHFNLVVLERSSAENISEFRKSIEINRMSAVDSTVQYMYVVCAEIQISNDGSKRAWVYLYFQDCVNPNQWLKLDTKFWIEEFDHEYQVVFHIIADRKFAS